MPGIKIALASSTVAGFGMSAQENNGIVRQVALFLLNIAPARLSRGKGITAGCIKGGFTYRCSATGESSRCCVGK